MLDFRIVETTRTNIVTGEVIRQYRIQESVRAWYFLWLFSVWEYVCYDIFGIPLPYVFDTHEEAEAKIKEFRHSRQWQMAHRIL